MDYSRSHGLCDSGSTDLVQLYNVNKNPAESTLYNFNTVCEHFPSETAHYRLINE